MPPLSLPKLSIQDVLDSFPKRPEEIEIKDKRYPSRTEINETRKGLVKNLLSVPCYDLRMSPINWAILVMKEEKYKEIKVNKHNAPIIAEALRDVKADKAKTDADAAEALTVDSPEVKAVWETKIIDESSDEAQLPTFPNPGLFTPEDSWNQKKVTQKLELYHMDRDNYERHMIIQHACRKWLEAIYGSHAWDDLQKDDDEYQEMLLLRDIMDHLESKATKNEPVDIDTEVEKLRTPYNPIEGMPTYFQRLKIIQSKLKNTEEPQSDTTLKRHAKKNVKASTNAEIYQRLGKR